MAIKIYTETPAEIYPYAAWSGTHLGQYTNKVWDTVAVGWVHWTTDFEDVNGVMYPGPGVFGISTSMYRVETIVFTEFNQ